MGLFYDDVLLVPQKMGISSRSLVKAMDLEELTAISPVDGRYRRKTASLAQWFSEFGFMRMRVRVEVEYLTYLLKILGKRKVDLQKIWQDFSLEDARWIKNKEEEIRHDVKAIEYFLRERLEKWADFVHLGLTSDDVTTSAYALSLSECNKEVIIPAIADLEEKLKVMALANKESVMLGRTHGQAAVPTTMGKELTNFLVRVIKIRENLTDFPFESKLSGAVGNFNALVVTYPKIDWVKFSDGFIKGMGLVPNHFTTQILPYDNWLEYFGKLKLLNNILIGFCQDIWRYISDDYLVLSVVKKEVGSSTMPQKVNPIDFENAEGNLGVANALFEFYERKLPISRLQRDLSDSTVKRTFGVALGHSLLAYQSLVSGLGLISGNKKKMAADLSEHWEVVAEGIQTILKTEGIEDAYEQLKELTRGKKLNKKNIQQFIKQLSVPKKIKKRLLALTPESYLGKASDLTWS